MFADAWSAPAFMKTNDATDNGGTLCGVPGATCTSGDWHTRTTSGFSWAQNIYAGLTAANLNAFPYWWGSSTTSENGDNEGLILINANDTVSASGRLWAFANYSRFIRPGAVRLGAASANSSVELTAFRNTNGSIAVVALNTATTPQPMTISLRRTSLPGFGVAVPYLTDSTSDTAAQAPVLIQNGSLRTTLPARSLVTYDIRG